MVECNDGTVSLAGGLAGACSGHGDVKLAVYDSATATSTTTPSASNPTVTASSGELAFTGPGPGLKTATIVGAVLMLLGIVMLLLSDPRRLFSQLAYLRLGTRGGRRNGAAYGATPLEARPPDLFRDRGEQSEAKRDLSVPADYGEVAGDSGGWLASDGDWYPPEQKPGYTHDAGADAKEQQAARHIEQVASVGSPPAAWYSDPLISGLRYWDGSNWTDHVAYRRRPTQRTGSWSDGDAEPTGLIDEITGRLAQVRRVDDGGPEFPGWWLTPDSE
jgi:uncharacterized protein DUF2510